METIALFPGITLHCVRDDRFRQGCLSVQLLRPMKKAEAAMNALLPAVLLRATRRCPNLRAITMHLDDLYGASVSPLVRRIGDYQTTGLYCGMMDDRFALPGDQVLAPMTQFLRELLLDSPLLDGGFLPEIVESEKRNLISVIDAERNDKRAYAMNRLLKTMCREDSFGIPRVGEREAVAAIDPKGLYAHYRHILATSPIAACYVGSAAPEEIAALLRPVFASLGEDRPALPPQTDFCPLKGEDLVETMEVTQGNLCMGFVTPITNRSPEFAAMQLLNILYGGGMTSKLFRNVREKQSLCYSISSGYYSSKGIVTVSAGIDPDTEEQTRREILAQLEACRRGEITDAELRAARESLISGLRAVKDSPSAMESYCMTGLYSGRQRSAEDYIREAENVTVADVCAAANTLQLHSTYFLKGGSQ